MNVQGYILCLSVVTTVEEVRERLREGILHDVEYAFHLYGDSDVVYTAPRWIIAEDIVFFYHTKTSINKIRSLRRKIKKQCASDNDIEELLNYVDESERLYNKYGGKIYAVGKVADRPFESDESSYEHTHFKSRIFAPISDVSELEYPIPLEQFEKVCPLGKQQTITGVFGKAFNELKKMIIRYNDVPCLKGKQHCIYH